MYRKKHGYYKPVYQRRNVLQGDGFSYRKVEKIGSGTYGVVYKAIDLKTENTVALKKIKSEDGQQPHEVGIDSLTLREISLLKEISHHPNIISLYQVISRKSCIWLVFKYCDYDLAKYMNKYKNNQSGKNEIPSIILKTICYQILNGMAYLHSSRIIHRDLKPQNILVDLSTQQIKIADFGLARTFEIGIIRKYSREVVTMYYRAPEILLGEDLYTISVDIWSIACIFGEMWNNMKVLFVGSSEIDQLYKIFKVCGTPNKSNYPRGKQLQFYSKKFPKWNPKPMQHIVPDLDYYGKDLLSRMLVLNPEKRINCKQAMKHPYFKQVISHKSNEKQTSWI